MRTILFPWSCALVLLGASVLPAESITGRPDLSRVTMEKHMTEVVASAGQEETAGDLSHLHLSEWSEFLPAHWNKFEAQSPALAAKTDWFASAIGLPPPERLESIPEIVEADARPITDYQATLDEQAIAASPALPLEVSLDAPSAPDFSTLTLWVAALVALISGLYYWQRPRKRRFA